MVEKLQFSIFYETRVPKVKFLEDQDGAANWECLLSTILENSSGSRSSSGQVLLRPDNSEITIPVFEAYEKFRKLLTEENELSKKLGQGFHFVDIPLEIPPRKSKSGGMIEEGVTRTREGMKLASGGRIRAFLSDIEGPKRLLQVWLRLRFKGLFLYNGALDSFSVLQSYYITSLASQMTNILISTLK